jgi:co-chaperonin GroES (HSP10)
MVRLDIKVGDTILMGRFKNKKVTVKTISFDEHGMPLINGKPICTFRYQKD